MAFLMHTLLHVLKKPSAGFSCKGRINAVPPLFLTHFRATHLIPCVSRRLYNVNHTSSLTMSSLVRFFSDHEPTVRRSSSKATFCISVLWEIFQPTDFLLCKGNMHTPLSHNLFLSYMIRAKP